jgi:dihydropteroate synthase
MSKCPAEENANSGRLQPTSERKNSERIGIKTNNFSHSRLDYLRLPLAAGKNRAACVLPSGARLDFLRPLVMSIVNCTPDSFYAGSRNVHPEDAAAAAEKAASEGADIIDFGAESTRPGSDYVGEEEELRRLLPALEAFRRISSLPVSVDTRKAAVARAALDRGADIINDISALEDDPAMAALCAERGAAVVLMHRRGIPKTMNETASSGCRGRGDGAAVCGGVSAESAPPLIVAEVKECLERAAEKALAAGIGREKIILDPGIGFGKTVAENCALVARLAEIGVGDYPLLVGLSRKSFVGELVSRGPAGRLAGTVAANMAALFAGAAIIRVHDTAEAVDTVKMFEGIVCPFTREY